MNLPAQQESSKGRCLIGGSQVFIAFDNDKSETVGGNGSEDNTHVVRYRPAHCEPSNTSIVSQHLVLSAYNNNDVTHYVLCFSTAPASPNSQTPTPIHLDPVLTVMINAMSSMSTIYLVSCIIYKGKCIARCEV